MIVAGFGFRSAANCRSLRAAYELAAGDHRVTLLATPEDKATALAITQLSRELNLPVVAVSSAKLQAAETPTQSSHSLVQRKTGSVAEAAALAAAGPGARLVSPRHISEDRHATCAVAIRGQS